MWFVVCVIVRFYYKRNTANSLPLYIIKTDARVKWTDTEIEIEIGGVLCCQRMLTFLFFLIFELWPQICRQLSELFIDIYDIFHSNMKWKQEPEIVFGSISRKLNFCFFLCFLTVPISISMGNTTSIFWPHLRLWT